MKLPPAVQIFLNELDLETFTKADVERLLSDRQFLTDVKDQAVHGMTVPIAQPLENRLVLAGSMDPFAPFSKCMDPDCRVHFAETVARTAAVYADNLVVFDHLSPMLSGDFDTNDVYGFLLVVRALLPLINADVVRFDSLETNFCRQHFQEAQAAIDTCEDELWRYYLKGARAEALRTPEAVILTVASAVDTCDGQELKYLFEITRDKWRNLTKGLQGARRRNVPKSVVRRLGPTFRPRLRRQVTAALIAASRSATSGGLLATSSRVDALALREIEKPGRLTSHAPAWEQQRAVTLPYVSQLSVGEIVELREKAAQALPQFRAAMARRLTAGALPSRSERRALEIARELKAETAHLEAELASLSLQSGKPVLASAAVGAVACVVFGLATSDPTAVNAGAGLVAALGALHPSHANTKKQIDALKRSPSYVLWVAGDLLAHRPPTGRP